jgi:DNA polymerase III subunit delta'
MSLKKAIIGNERIAEMLEKSYNSDKLSHAYLFEGLDHIGKKTLALAFCRLILQNSSIKENGANNNSDIEKNPDLIILRPDEDKKQIAIEQIRDLQKSLSLFPYSSKYKITIIEQADKMSKSAANAILKTLEEPSKTTIIILLTSSSNNLLDTIKSRCQTFKFMPVKRKALEKFLEDKASDKMEADKIIEMSGYRPGKIVELMNNKPRIAELSDIITSFSSIAQKKDFERLDEAEIISKKEVEEIVNLLDLYSFYLRKVLLKEYAAGGVIKNKISKIRNNINLTENIKENILTKNINTKLALENLFLQA